MPCPLCLAPQTVPFLEDDRPYRRCPRCWLVHVPASHHLSPAAEKAQYDLHDNRVDDPGYRRFLARAADPLRARLDGPTTGIDIGCGPGPALAAMLTEDGHAVATWDPHYAPDPAPLAHAYGFVTCTEVVEHARDPRALWALLGRLRAPDGWLVVMTGRWESPEAFVGWHYRRDPTHIAFHHAETLRWVAGWLDLRVDLVGRDVAVLGPRPDA